VLAGVYVAITLAVGFPAGAAAAYGVQHGLDVDAASALNSMRVFAYLLAQNLVLVPACSGGRAMITCTQSTAGNLPGSAAADPLLG